MLLPVTLAIWGFIGYKVYQYMNADDDEPALSGNIMPVASEVVAPDTFALFNNYRDPFLGDDGREMAGLKKQVAYSGQNPGVHSSTGNKPPKKNTSVVPVAVPANSGWPKISYNGMMINESNKQSIAFISVDGNSQRVKPGDNINDLKILSFDQNGITIQKGKEKKTFGK